MHPHAHTHACTYAHTHTGTHTHTHAQRECSYVLINAEFSRLNITPVTGRLPSERDNALLSGSCQAAVKQCIVSFRW